MNTYENGVENGYEVVSAVQHTKGKSVPELESWVKTPYTYEGQPLMGHATTVLENKPDAGVRQSHGVELWTVNPLGQPDRNLEDVTGGQPYTVADKSGNPVPGNDAVSETGRFTASASERPHVFQCQEFIEAKTPVYKRMELGEPTARDYEKYLDSVEKQMLSGVEFVGEIKDRNGLHQAMNSVPAFDDFMHEAGNDGLGM